MKKSVYRGIIPTTHSKAPITKDTIPFIPLPKCNHWHCITNYVTLFSLSSTAPTFPSSPSIIHLPNLRSMWQLGQRLGPNRRTNKFTFFASSLLNVGTLEISVKKVSLNPIESKKSSSLVVTITRSFFPWKHS